MSCAFSRRTRLSSLQRGWNIASASANQLFVQRASHRFELPVVTSRGITTARASASRLLLNRTVASDQIALIQLRRWLRNAGAECSKKGDLETFLSHTRTLNPKQRQRLQRMKAVRLRTRKFQCWKLIA